MEEHHLASEHFRAYLLVQERLRDGLRLVVAVAVTLLDPGHHRIRWQIATHLRASRHAIVLAGKLDINNRLIPSLIYVSCRSELSVRMLACLLIVLST